MFELVDNEEIAGIEKTAEDKTYENKLPKGYLSVSQVTQYMKCGEAYYRRYVLDEKIQSNSFMVQGRAVHKAAEKLHLGIMEGYTMPIEEVEAVYSDLHDREMVDAVIPEGEGTGSQIKDVGLNLARKYHKVAIGDEVDLTTGFKIPPVKPVAAERIIRTKIATDEADDIPFVAVIDLEEEDAIADLKTKKQAGAQAEADNSIQLSLYAHMTGKPVVRLDQLVKPTKTMGARFIRRTSVRTKKEVLHALDIVAEVAEDISAGRLGKRILKIGGALRNGVPTGRTAGGGIAMDNSDQWGSVKPNLSKLPAHVRESLTRPIPMRPEEFHSKVIIYTNTPGLQHPNGRVYVQGHQRDPLEPGEIDAVQIDFLDFSGRYPLVSSVVPLKRVQQLIDQLKQYVPEATKSNNE